MLISTLLVSAHVSKCEVHKVSGDFFISLVINDDERLPEPIKLGIQMTPDEYTDFVELLKTSNK